MASRDPVAAGARRANGASGPRRAAWLAAGLLVCCSFQRGALESSPSPDEIRRLSHSRLPTYPLAARDPELARRIELSCLLPLVQPGMERAEVVRLLGEPDERGRYYTGTYLRVVEYDAQDRVVVPYGDLYQRGAQRFGDPNELRALQQLAAHALDGPLPVEDLHWPAGEACLTALRRLGYSDAREAARRALAEVGPTSGEPREYLEALREYADAVVERPLTLACEVSRLGEAGHRFSFSLENTSSSELTLWVAPHLFSLCVESADGVPVRTLAVLKRFLGRFESHGRTISLEPGQVYFYATTELTAIEGGAAPSEWALVPLLEEGTYRATGTYVAVDRFLRQSLEGVWSGSVASEEVRFEVERR